MAIDIEWQIRPSKADGEGKERALYPRVVNDEPVDADELVRRIVLHGTQSRGVVSEVLDDLADVMRQLLSEGREVRVPSLGNFRLAVGSKGLVHTVSSTSARLVAVRGVNFQPNDDLMAAVGKPTFRLVSRDTVGLVPSAEDLRPRLEAYLQSHLSITGSEFARLFGLRHTTAATRLRQLVETGILRREGYNRDTRYVKA